MAERNAALRRAPDRPELRALLARAGSATLTEEQLRRQKAKFVYGNTSKGAQITKESAGRSIDRNHLGALTAFDGLDPDTGR